VLPVSIEFIGSALVEEFDCCAVDLPGLGPLSMTGDWFGWRIIAVRDLEFADIVNGPFIDIIGMSDRV